MRLKLYEEFILEGKAPDTSGNWFHGDRHKTDFKNRKFDVEDYKNERNAVGPGIYFTRLKWQANGYAGKGGFLYTVQVDLDPTRVLEDKTPTDKKKLLEFIKMAPDKEGLYNYDEDPERAVYVALELNGEEETMHQAVMGIYNDLYQMDSTAFANAMVKIGYDAMFHRLPAVNHLLVWNVDKIRIVREENYKEPKYK